MHNNNGMDVKTYTKYLIRKVLFNISGFFVGLVPKQKGLILFTAWFGNKYIDNSKYVYEYFLGFNEYKPVWMTRRKEIYQELTEEGKPVARFDSLKGKWLQARAQVVVSSVQFTDYNVWLLNKCVFLDLGHGHPIKDPGAVIHNDYMSKIYDDILKRVHYYSVVAGSKSKKNYRVVNAPQENLFVSDFARNDVFEDAALRLGKNVCVEEYKNGRKAIVYMPTHRSDGKKTMEMSKILPLPEIQDFCEKNNLVFIIKKHYYHNKEKEDLSSYPNIFDITNVEDIDPQILLWQTDILISDYSACYIDYMLLKRPLIFFHYDIKEFNSNERKLKYDFEEINIAPIVYSKESLVKTIDKVSKSEDIYLEKRMIFAKENYFDNIGKQEGRKKDKEIIDGLMRHYYGR